MSYLRSRLTASAVLLLFAAAPVAVLADSGPSVGVSAATTGLGLTVAYPLGNDTQIRAQSGTFSGPENFTAGGNGYSGNVKLNNLLVTGELHPGGGRGFVAAGVMVDWDRITASATSSNLQIGSSDYGPGTASIQQSWNRYSPYVGVGIGPARGGGFGADLGFAFHGAGYTALSTNVAGVNPTDAALAQNQVQSTFGNFRAYPVAGIRYSIGI